MRLLTALLLALVLTGCGEDKELVVVLKNESGKDMEDFELRVGGERIQYSVFTNGYTFRNNVVPLASEELHVSSTAWRDSLGWTVEPEHVGGELRVTFTPSKDADVQFRPIRGVSPSKRKGVNLKYARKYYDAIDPGMEASEALRYTGHTHFDKRKFSSSKDFGYYNKASAVTFFIWFYDDKVARVALALEFGPKAGTIISEKGMSLEEYEALPMQ